MTWNPVVGCKNHCSYCYARKIAKRFAKVWAMAEYDPHSYSIPSDDKIDRAVEGLSNDLKKFISTFLYRQYHKKLPKKPQRIFVGSMSEIYYWEEKWMSMVLDRIKLYPQHTFQFLTRHPEIYTKYIFPKNCWLGVTIVNNDELYKMDFTSLNRIKFINIEPILEKIDARYIEYINTGKFFSMVYQKINWVIVGFQTNPFKKIEKEAITDIIEITRKNSIPLFLKDSIYKGYPDLPIIKEFPECIEPVLNANI
jgi:protein gp37